MPALNIEMFEDETWHMCMHARALMEEQNQHSAQQPRLLMYAEHDTSVRFACWRYAVTCGCSNQLACSSAVVKVTVCMCSFQNLQLIRRYFFIVI